MQTTWKNESVSVGSTTVTMEYRDERLTTLKLSRPLGVRRADFEAAIDEVNNRCPRDGYLEPISNALIGRVSVSTWAVLYDA